jgi:FtsH-binding integral membrane protein
MNSQWNQSHVVTQGLRLSNATFMSRVYFWMMLGLVITGIISYEAAHSPALVQYLFSRSYLMIGLIILQLGAVIVLSATIHRMNLLLATTIYLFYTALTGLTFSAIFLVYTAQSISQVFFITAFAFSGLSVFGYLSKRDLGPLGSFCITGLFGLIGFMLIAFIFPSIQTTAVSMTINTLGILIFAGLTAYDTQKIKEFNVANANTEELKKRSIQGALTLYLDFINLFLNLLRLFGQRR